MGMKGKGDGPEKKRELHEISLTHIMTRKDKEHFSFYSTNFWYLSEGNSNFKCQKKHSKSSR